MAHGRCEQDVKRRIGLATRASASLNNIRASKEINRRSNKNGGQIISACCLYSCTALKHGPFVKRTKAAKLRAFEMAVMMMMMICGACMLEMMKNVYTIGLLSWRWMKTYIVAACDTETSLVILWAHGENELSSSSSSSS